MLKIGDMVIEKDMGTRLRGNKVGIITSTQEHDYGSLHYPQYEIVFLEVRFPRFLNDDHLLVADENIIQAWIPKVGDEVFVIPKIEERQHNDWMFVEGVDKYLGKRTKIKRMSGSIIKLEIDENDGEATDYTSGWYWYKKWLIPLKAFVSPSAVIPLSATLTRAINIEETINRMKDRKQIEIEMRMLQEREARKQTQEQMRNRIRMEVEARRLQSLGLSGSYQPNKVAYKEGKSVKKKSNPLINISFRLIGKIRRK